MPPVPGNRCVPTTWRARHTEPTDPLGAPPGDASRARRAHGSVFFTISTGTAPRWNRRGFVQSRPYWRASYEQRADTLLPERPVVRPGFTPPNAPGAPCARTYGALGTSLCSRRGNCRAVGQNVPIKRCRIVGSFQLTRDGLWGDNLAVLTHTERLTVIHLPASLLQGLPVRSRRPALPGHRTLRACV